jgi:predicted PurR-regulated permease PerM
MHQNFQENLLFRITLVMVFLFLFIWGMYAASFLLIPFSFATLISMLLLPVCQRLERFKFGRAPSILISILLLILFFAGLIFALSTQIAGFASDAPRIRENLIIKFERIQEYIFQNYGVAPEKQLIFIRDQLDKLLEGSGEYVQSVLLSTTGAFTSIMIVIFYVFLILYYRNRFHNFILRLISPVNEEKTRGVIKEISAVTQHYLTGVLTVILILAIMNTTGLLIVGVEHAIFFGVLAAILNIIPYIGTFIGGLIPSLYALVTKDSLGAVAATAAVFITSQFIENNFLTPFIVGSKVKVNPLATIVFLLVGGGIWGVSGMILFIPFLGVLKIVFDNVEALHPFGYLIGEEESEDPTVWTRLSGKLKFWKKKK